LVFWVLRFAYRVDITSVPSKTVSREFSRYVYLTPLLHGIKIFQTER
jgi:hypothetical protein